MIVIGLDPGYQQSAVVAFNGASVVSHATLDNYELLRILPNMTARPQDDPGPTLLVIEEMQMFASYGVGKEVFDSVFWSGRFAQAWSPRRFHRLIRSKVRAHLCHTNKGGDAQIRAALIERFGPYKEQAIGSKAKPGPLAGVVGHEWSALALAVVWFDLHGHEDPVRPGVNAEFT